MIARRDMARSLSLSTHAPTKTFVLEVHTNRPSDYLASLVGARVVETEDAFLQVLHTSAGAFWVDHLDGRFWSFHTDMPARAAYRVLHQWVTSRRDLDWMWLPSDHLRNLWPGAMSQRVHTEFSGHDILDETVTARDLRVQLSGRYPEELLDLIARDDRFRHAVAFDSVQVLVNEPDFGVIREGVNRRGRFAVSGDALDLHLQLVRKVVARYSNLVQAVEQRSMTYERFEAGGGHVRGRPIMIKFSRPISSMDRFLGELFSSREPFRLWGMPELVEGIAEVEAVDLHVGETLRMDVGQDWLRAYVQHGTCGNTIARLVTNLQHRFDGSLTILDPEIQAAVEGNSHTLEHPSHSR